MVTTKQKVTLDPQKIKRRKSKHATIENLQITKEGSKKEKREQGNKPKTINKMTLVSP